MKKKLIIEVFIIVLVVIGLLLLIIGLTSNNNKVVGEIPEEYRNNTYSISLNYYCSCLTFGEKNKFYEYDCDSEPTNMPYNGEFYNKYSYDSENNLITFTSDDKTFKEVTAEILEINKDKIKIKVKGSKQDKNCSVNGKDIYEYYRKIYKYKGSEMIEFLDNLNSDGNLIVEFWNQEGYHTCTSKNIEICENSELITLEEIKNTIEKDNEYELLVSRDENGKIISVYLDKAKR